MPKRSVSEFSDYTVVIHANIMDGIDVVAEKLAYSERVENLPRKFLETAHFKHASQLFDIVFASYEKGDLLEAFMYSWGITEMWRIKSEHLIGSKTFYGAFKAKKNASAANVSFLFRHAFFCALRDFIWCEYKRENWLEELKAIFEEAESDLKGYYRDQVYYWIDRAKSYESENCFAFVALCVSMAVYLVDGMRFGEKWDDVGLIWLNRPILDGYELSEFRLKSP